MSKFLLTACKVIVIIGALNWGFVGFLGINPVNLSFAKIPFISANVIYMLVGVCGIAEIFTFRKQA
ncbi:DUF378 domain-containing protein [Pseudomonadota bacterium]